MIEIVWEFTVKEDEQGQFELAYGPGGAWSKLFSGCVGFRGTSLLRDVENPRRYLTVDVWDTLDLREQALVDHQAEYAELDASFADWTDSEREVGIFRMLAEGSVRPQPKSRQSKSGRYPRSGRHTTR